MSTGATLFGGCEFSNVGVLAHTVRALVKVGPDVMPTGRCRDCHHVAICGLWLDDRELLTRISMIRM